MDFVCECMFKDGVFPKSFVQDCIIHVFFSIIQFKEFR